MWRGQLLHRIKTGMKVGGHFQARPQPGNSFPALFVRQQPGLCSLQEQSLPVSSDFSSKARGGLLIAWYPLIMLSAGSYSNMYVEFHSTGFKKHRGLEMGYNLHQAKCKKKKPRAEELTALSPLKIPWISASKYHLPFEIGEELTVSCVFVFITRNYSKTY